MNETIQIDGSYGEGGGQIIRTSLSLSAITGKPVEVVNVRARRSKPGLQAQHLTAVRAAAFLCAAETPGAEVGSTHFTFRPQSPVSSGNYRFDIGTAGATPLVAQTVLIPLALAGGPSRVMVTGGTHVPHSPVADYLERVYLPTVAAFGLDARVSYEEAGFFPKGGGKLLLEVSPSRELAPVQMLERGKLTALTAFIVTSNLPEHVAHRGAAAVESFMKGIGRDVVVRPLDKPSIGPGAAVVLVAECEGGRAGFTSIGERGKPMEKVAEQACADFLKWWKTGTPVDERLADQLVLPASLAAGESRWRTPRVSEHLRTVIWLAQQFLPIEVKITEEADGSGEIALESWAKPR